MKIPADHPDAGKPLLWAAARALARMGARVEIAADGENLVRRIARRDDGAVALVVAQGLPNLLHELVHAVQTGVVDDDWGIDYGAIPFDLRTPSGRRMLWEELACCVLSCAYLQAPEPGESPSQTERRVDAWFREQLGIQPVFFGMEDDPEGFWSFVQALALEHHDELHATLTHAQAATAHAMRHAGAHAQLCAPPRSLTVGELFARTAASARAGLHG